MNLEMQIQVEKINEMRISVIENLEGEIPVITQLISEKEYLVTTLSFDDSPGECYIMVDFTSKQIEHLHDLKRYTKKIYRNFMTEPYIC